MLATGDESMRSMLAFWNDQKGDIDPELLREFNEKLRREWAVETGLIERIYTLDRGITEMLIERGIDEALIPHRPGRQLPEKTAAIIRDHKNVVDGLFDFVRGNRKITTSYIKELHAALVQNQDTAIGVDSRGNKREVPLLKGAYKKHPNNPTRGDGKGTHEYCPPEHTASEMDTLIQINDDFDSLNISATPEVRAAFLHHRFTQIHPFQDGNGRVARCLATLIFIRAGGFPLTIRDINDEREKYIDALEIADCGDLQPLVSIFAASQRREIIKALNISRKILESAPANADYQSRTENIIKSAARKIAEREAQNDKRDNAQIIAGKMHKISMEMLMQTRRMLNQNISTSGEEPERPLFIVRKGTGDNRNMRYMYSPHCAIPFHFGYSPNPEAYHEWVNMILRPGIYSSMLISLHGAGKTYRGAIACVASYLSTGADEPMALTDEPFYINNQDTVADVEKRFRPWLESAIERGLAMWHKSL